VIHYVVLIELRINSDVAVRK